MASSGTLNIDQMPAAVNIPMSIRTRNLLFAENSMIRSIMLVRTGRALKLALRVDQERPGRDDALTCTQTVENLDAVAKYLAGFYLARFQVAVAAIDEHGL